MKPPAPVTQTVWPEATAAVAAAAAASGILNG